MRPFHHRAAACCLALVAALSLGACGSASHPLDATAENDGFYVHLDGVSYQLQVSRELNPYLVEDHLYLTGLPSGESRPTGDELWYGVFLRAINNSHQTHATSDSFTIVDTQNDSYSPVPLDSSVNQYAWTSQPLAPLGTEPTQDSTAYFGPTQGGLVLFKLPTSVYANRPVTLRIQGAGGSQDVATISLDL